MDKQSINCTAQDKHKHTIKYMYLLEIWMEVSTVIECHSHGNDFQTVLNAIEELLRFFSPSIDDDPLKLSELHLIRSSNYNSIQFFEFGYSTQTSKCQTYIHIHIQIHVKNFIWFSDSNSISYCCNVVEINLFK